MFVWGKQGKGDRTVIELAGRGCLHLHHYLPEPPSFSAEHRARTPSFAPQRGSAAVHLLCLRAPTPVASRDPQRDSAVLQLVSRLVATHPAPAFLREPIRPTHSRTPASLSDPTPVRPVLCNACLTARCRCDSPHGSKSPGPRSAGTRCNACWTRTRIWSRIRISPRILLGYVVYKVRWLRGPEALMPKRPRCLLSAVSLSAGIEVPELASDARFIGAGMHWSSAADAPLTALLVTFFMADLHTAMLRIDG